jgi:hypothetical protein
MARPITLITDTFKVLRDNINTISNNVGDPDLLTTTTRAFTLGNTGVAQRSDSSDVVSALNELDSDLHGAGGGDVKNDLNYISYAINRVRDSGMTGAMNAIDAYIGGDSDTLNVEANTIKDAINEIEAVFDASTLKINAGGDFRFDGAGDLEVNLDGGDVTFLSDSDQYAHFNLRDSAADFVQTYTHSLRIRTADSAAGNVYLDAGGDITLDADGGNVYLKDGGATHFDYSLGSTNTVTVTGNLTHDVSGDIVLDAGTLNIDFLGAGTTRFAYGLGASNTLDVTGNLSEVVSGTYTESAGGNYHVGNTGTYEVVPTGNATVDAGGDIILDADGGNVTLKDDDSAAFDFSLVDGIVSRTGHTTLDVSGNITLDADGGNTYIKDGGTTQFQFIAGTNKEIDVPAGNLTVDVAGDIVLDADGGDIDFKDNGTARFSYGLGATNTLEVNGNLTQTVSGNVIDSANGTYTVTSTDDMSHTTLGRYTLSADSAVIITSDSAIVNSAIGFAVNTTNGYIDLNASGAYGTVRVDADHAIVLDADDGDIYINDGGITAYHIMSSGTISRDGDLTLDISGDITLDADGGDVFLKDGGTQYGALTNTSGNLIVKSGTTTALTFSGANVTTGGNITVGGNTISRTGALTLDVSSGISLDAGTGIVYLKDNGITYGSLRNPAGAKTLDIYSNTTKAIGIDSSSNVTITGTVTEGTTLGTTSTHLGGAINEIHTELDSATTDLQTTKGRVTNLESQMDSNEGIIGVSVEWNADNTYSWIHSTSNRAAINDLDSAIGHLADLDNTTFAGANDKDNVVTALNVLAGDVQDVQGDAGTLDSRIGSLANLAAFFDSAGATSSIVNALNHMASRVVNVYDENGTLLNT